MEEATEIVDIKALISKMEKLTGEELVSYRMKLREAIRGITESIDVYPGGVEGLAGVFTKKGKTMDNSTRLFVVMLKGGFARAIAANGQNVHYDFDSAFKVVLDGLPESTVEKLYEMTKQSEKLTDDVIKKGGK
jgi:hypothetical protein